MRTPMVTAHDEQSGTPAHESRATGRRLSLLLSYAGWRDQNWADQLPCLLEPMGVQAIRVQSGDEAGRVIDTQRVDIAVVDMGLPLACDERSSRGASSLPLSTQHPPGQTGWSGGREAGSHDRPWPSKKRETAGSETPMGGIRLLQLLRRLAEPPPIVVVRRPAVEPRANTRALHDALREGAFAVIDAPVQLEMLLEVMRRILKRHYSDTWPGHGAC
ncbi:MAG: hypothetical protein HND57_15695 [Planctomycetes bacterium]|nr:hypothetical protein [Planctomycetota bacterium]